MRELKPQKRRSRFVGRLLVFLVVAAGAGLYGWGKFGEAAMRREVARYRAAGEAILPDAFAPVPLADDENAAMDLIAASERIQQDAKVYWATSGADALAPYDEEEMVIVGGVVRRCADVWPRLAAAEAKPRANWDVGDRASRQVLSASIWRAGQLQSFLQAAARYFHQTGDDPRALQCVRDLLFLARAARQAPDGYATATEIDRSAAHTVLHLATGPHPIALQGDASRDAARAIIADLQDERPRQASFAESLRLTRAQAFERLQGAADGRWNLFGCAAGVEDRVSRPLLRPMILANFPILMRGADQVIAAALAAPDLPTLVALVPDRNGPREARERPTLHMIAGAFAPRYEYRMQEHFEAVTERRLAATALAIRLYAADHGSTLPAALGELVPTYMPALPADPMLTGRPLTYRPGSVDPLLYSVGADGKDDGGSEEPQNAGGAIPDEWGRLSRTRDAVVHLNGTPVPTAPSSGG